MANEFDYLSFSFSPDGRLFQVEYAKKAVDRDSLAIGVRCSDGILFAGEINLKSSLMKKAANHHTYWIDEKIGCIAVGYRPDCFRAIIEARKEASNWTTNFGTPITVAQLVNRLSLTFHQYHSVSGRRPFGCTLIVGSKVDNQLYAIEPSGQFYGYYASAFGKSASLARAELQKTEWQSITVKDAIPEVAKIIQNLHDAQNKKWEIEMMWITDESKGCPQIVPFDVFEPTQN